MCQHMALVVRTCFYMFLYRFRSKPPCKFLHSYPYRLLYILLRRGLRMFLHKYPNNFLHMRYSCGVPTETEDLIIVRLPLKSV